MTRRAFGLPTLTAAALAACTAAPEQRGLDALPEWRAELEVRIGSIDDPDYALTFVRQIEAGPEGRMYTLHPMEQAVRVFSEGGEIETLIGGRGGGPGEFENVFTMGWVADTLWVLDGQGYRFNQFAPDGEFLGSFTVPFQSDRSRTVQPPRAAGLLFDGTVHGSPPAFSSQVASGELTHHVPMLMTREGGVTDTLPSIAFGRNQWTISDPDDPRRGTMFSRQPFADGPLWSFVPGERALIVLERSAPSAAEGAAFSVAKIGFSGDTAFSRDYPFEPVPIDAQVLDSVLGEMASMLVEREILGVSSVQMGRRWAEGDLYRPEFMPAVSELVVAKDGSVWISRGDDGEGGRRWIVLDHAGTPTGALSLPDGLSNMVVDPPFIWAAETDELDVPYLVRFRVIG